MKRLILKKVNDVEGKEQCHVDMSHRFAALENLKTLRWILIQLGKLLERISKLKKHNPSFNERCSKLLGQWRKPNCSGYRMLAK
jgi:hypothetical protein